MVKNDEEKMDDHGNILYSRNHYASICYLIQFSSFYLFSNHGSC